MEVLNTSTNYQSQLKKFWDEFTKNAIQSNIFRGGHLALPKNHSNLLQACLVLEDLIKEHKKLNMPLETVKMEEAIKRALSSECKEIIKDYWLSIWGIVVPGTVPPEFEIPIEGFQCLASILQLIDGYLNREWKTSPVKLQLDEIIHLYKENSKEWINTTIAQKYYLDHEIDCPENMSYKMEALEALQNYAQRTGLPFEKLEKAEVIKEAKSVISKAIINYHWFHVWTTVFPDKPLPSPYI